MSMGQEEFEAVKQKMREYRDYYGDKLNHDLIDSAKNMIALDNVFSNHLELIETSAIEAADSLKNFKKDLGVSRFGN